MLSIDVTNPPPPASHETTSESTPIEKLPSFFPLVVPRCKAPAEDFFKCFSHSSQALDDRNRPVEESIYECQESLAAYESCMKLHYEHTEKKRKRFLGIF